MTDHTALELWEARRAAGEVDYPDLDGRPAKHYGTKIVNLGEDGEVYLIFGHVPARHALAVVNRMVRVDFGWKNINEWTSFISCPHTKPFGDPCRKCISDQLADLLDLFVYRWARIMTNCDSFPQCSGPNPKRDGEDRPIWDEDEDGPDPYCRQCDLIATYAWWVMYSVDNTVDTPGAFPVTVLEV